MNSVLDILNYFLPYTPFFFMCYIGVLASFFPLFFGGLCRSFGGSFDTKGH